MKVNLKYMKFSTFPRRKKTKQAKNLLNHKKFFFHYIHPITRTNVRTVVVVAENIMGSRSYREKYFRSKSWDIFYIYNKVNPIISISGMNGKLISCKSAAIFFTYNTVQMKFTSISS